MRTPSAAPALGRAPWVGVHPPMHTDLPGKRKKAEPAFQSAESELPVQGRSISGSCTVLDLMVIFTHNLEVITIKEKAFTCPAIRHCFMSTVGGNLAIRQCGSFPGGPEGVSKKATWPRCPLWKSGEPTPCIASFWGTDTLHCKFYCRTLQPATHLQRICNEQPRRPRVHQRNTQLSKA